MNRYLVGSLVVAMVVATGGVPASGARIGEGMGRPEATPAIGELRFSGSIRISVPDGGGEANDGSYVPSVSSDGSVVAYMSTASNLDPGDDDRYLDVYVFDIGTATTRLLTGGHGGSHPQVSADGSTVVFEADGRDLVPGDTNYVSDVFSYDIATGIITRVSVSSTGEQANYYSDRPAVSGDGGTIVYHSGASNLVDEETPQGMSNVFTYEVATGETRRISAGGGSARADISDDGSTIVFWSSASNLVANDDNGFADIFRYDVDSGTTTLVSQGPGGVETDGDSYCPKISGDGSTIVYPSAASSLVAGDNNGVVDVFAYNVSTGETTRVSVSSSGVEANKGSVCSIDVSGNGSIIVFTSEASNLVSDDGNGAWDIFARDVSSGTTTRLTTDEDVPTNRGSGNPAVSADGSTVVYESGADSLVPGDTNEEYDIFLTHLHRGDFVDDDSSIFEADIEWLAAEGITLGCNPPVNDMFCPNNVVTRGQMAAFLVRALNLTDDGDGDLFVDDDGSVFEASIDKLATAGVTRGCNPPDNTMFCPNHPVTRGQMAAFLVRALGYTDDGGGNLFIDDDGNIFETSIDKLATAGVTRGCNPPVNDMFCPHSNVTRGQMAAFLHRALGE